MQKNDFVSYLRVSTQKQGSSGLGLDAQRAAVESFVAGTRGTLIAEYQEVETGKGSDALSKRPTLKAALEYCRKHGATLVIAKLDRLARNVHFVSGLMESRVRFVACDMPEANELTIHIMAAFAEHEAKRISQRTKEALAVAKARGVALGTAGASNLKPNLEMRQQAAQAFVERLRALFDEMSAKGLSQRAMAEELNKIGSPAPKGGKWGLTQVQRAIAQLQSASCAI
ncbi:MULTISPECIES: recombinase family protein [Pseudomonas]|uniref:DNA-invertase hin n=1 Tax=Pseudomonas putida TaxID=303 RepID=A0A1B2F6T8_PSEPU|nr:MULTISPECIES: recombinase family protein [Pseudomonas]ANY87998.1 DNA-invertase hin [Pseudomonas putida]MCL8308367.1 recombinase family protein [Pseudomonas putida]